MKIFSIIVRKNYVIVKFEQDIENLRLSYNVYTNYYLYSGKEIDDKLYKQMKKDSELDKTIEWAKKYLIKRPRSVFLFKKKLSTKKVSYKDSKQIVRVMKELGLLNDQKYADEYVYYLDKHNYGKNYIMNKLYKAGIPYNIISNLIFDITREKEKLLNVYREFKKKYNNHEKNVYNYLLSYGFEEEIIESFLLENECNATSFSL